MRRITIALASLILIGTFILTLQYYHTEIFRKEAGKPFQGNCFYNPYANFNGNTVRANFHAHSAAWFNLTNGAQSPNEVINHYHNHGYDVISLSNYQKITRDTLSALSIPAYEHGYNIKKRHHIVINPSRVSFFDFAVFQNYHHKQQVLKKLGQEDQLIALAHPRFMQAYSLDDMKYLGGYQLMEVFTYYRPSAEPWDAALSSGHPVWIMANDDCHNIHNEGQTMNSWNVICPGERTREGVIKALRAGCHYGVHNPNHVPVNALDSCLLSNETIRVYLRSKANRIVFVSDNGHVRSEVTDRASATYTISPNDTYVRVEVYTGDEKLFLNPIIRSANGEMAYSALPKVDVLRTVLFRILVLIISTINIVLLLLLNGRFRAALRVLRGIRSGRIRTQSAQNSVRLLQ